MDTNRRFLTLFTVVVLCVICFVPGSDIYGQGQCEVPNVDFRIDLMPTLENAQELGLATLGLDSEGKGPVLGSVSLQNLEDSVISNLYLEFSIEAAKKGVIISFRQKGINPFSLDPRQLVYVTNNNITDDAIPGVEETVSFEETENNVDEFFEDLDDVSTLPSDVYTVSATLSRRTNACGTQELATAFAEIGGEAFISEEQDIFLRTPGDVIDGNVEITNPFPQFSWEGEAGIEYRLVVVNDNGQDSPESLLQGATSTEPTTSGGSLLEFENLDVTLTGNTFQYPSSGAQPLEEGQTYYWQVIASIQTGNSSEERSSEVWSFVLSKAESGEPTVVINNEIRRTLVSFLGEDAYNRLKEAGFSLQNIEIDGVVMSGPQATIKLAEILQKIEDGDIIIGERQ